MHQSCYQNCHTVPAHIDQEKIPDYCYWDKNKQHWYTIRLHPGGKATRQRIDNKHASLGDLHSIMDQLSGTQKNTFEWLSKVFHKSKIFKDYARKTKNNYEYCQKIINDYPTKIGEVLGSIPLHKWDNGLVQTLVDQLEEERGPTAANLCLKYIRRVFRWGKNRAGLKNNPAEGIDPATERKLRRLPDSQVLIKLIELAKARGKLKGHVKGSCAPYLWCSFVIGYECRLRGIETNSLTDAHILDEGILCQRTKGSRTNITSWNIQLRDAVDCLVERRKQIWDKKRCPTPVRPEDRHLFINQTGGPLNKSSLDSAFTRFMKMAIDEGIIEESQRFGLHDLKRRGTTDTQGTRAEKQEAAGWKSQDMVDIYDCSIPLVNPVTFIKKEQ
jgi:site-specific recombinase XerC